MEVATKYMQNGLFLYICIYIERERGRERERVCITYMLTCITTVDFSVRSSEQTAIVLL